MGGSSEPDVGDGDRPPPPATTDFQLLPRGALAHGFVEARATEETDKNLTKILKKRQGEDERRSSPMVHVRANRTKAERAGALAELVKQRRDAARRGSSRQCSSVDKVDLPAANVSTSNLTSSNEEESSWDDMSSSDEDNKSPEPPTLYEVRGITVPRCQNWYSEVPVYRLCQVLNVDAIDPDRQYEFVSKTTCKYLNLVWGSGSPARWQMTVASNFPPNKVEFDQWLRKVKLTGGRMPTKQKLLEKRQALEKVNSFVYSAATVRQMVEEKRSAGWKPANIAAEKGLLRRELELARDDDVQKVKRIRARMQELETICESSRGSRDGLDLVAFSQQVPVQEQQQVLLPSLHQPQLTQLQQRHHREAGDAVGRGELADTTAPLDEERAPHVLHDFDVSVPVDKFGGARGAKAGYMAWKQHIEATVVCWG
ncbi:hypothetical protein C2S51_036424 [Perilla frutescens var. frutescens]|nr:hypothetical protein C2S51_036424 [Perilla frutescens var. frutescens]